jgi:hypothetical protein
MSAIMPFFLPRRLFLPRRRTIGLATAAVVGVCASAALSLPAFAFATLEPEVAAPAGLPGMPPAPRLPALLQQPPAAASQTAAAPPSATPAVAGSAPGGIAVVSWGIGPDLGSTAGEVAAGQPLYLWMTIEGSEAALERLSASGPIPVDVHWIRAAPNMAPGAPNLTTRLTIGRAQLAPLLAGEIRRQGFFAWHSWTRKDSLSPGAWTVSLTYPDGQPLMCGATAPQPCRFSVTIG